MVRKQSAVIDPLLEPLLLLTSDEQADDHLSQLIALQAEPVIRGIIGYKLHFDPHHNQEQSDAGDICQEAILQLLAALQRFRKAPDNHPVGDVRGLAAIIAHRACSRWMRRQFPRRHALKNRLYYLLTRQGGLAVWQNENKRLVAGFTLWQGQNKGLNEDRLRQLASEELLTARIRLLESGNRGNWAEMLAEIFNFLGSPIDFDRLVQIMAELMQIIDQPIESMEQLEDAIGFEAASERPDPAWQVEKRIFLQRLWEEVCQLPLNQRLALLLNLKDPEGRGCIALFPSIGVASLRQLADTLEMSVEKLAGIWNELPIEDAKIAELLQVTRQQVINIRKSARERLGRKLKGFF